MKGFNTILSILVVILAAAVAASSYMLWEKREFIAKGWNTQAKALEEISRVLDQKVSTDVTANSLDFKKNPKVAEQTAMVVSAAQAVINQRNNMADADYDIARTLELSPLPSKQFLKDGATYQAQQKIVIDGARKVIDQRDSFLQKLVPVFTKAKVQANINTLKGAMSTGNADDIAKVIQYIDALEARVAMYQDGTAKVGATVGIDGLNLQSNEQGGVASVVQKTADLKADRDDKLNLANQKDTQIATLESNVKDRENQVGVLKNSIKGKDDYIKQLRQTLNAGEGVIPDPWAPGSIEARKAVRAKVVTVNKEFGFLVINFGKDSIVIQPLGKNQNKVNPQVATGMIASIGRDINSDNPVVVCKVKLSKVMNQSTIVESSDVADINNVKVGDTVYFDEADLK